MTDRYVDGCIACKTNKGEIKPPGGAILTGQFWRLEHTLLPTVPGWLVLKTLRHVTDLTQMTRVGMVELADMLWLAEVALHEVVKPQRVYQARFCEVVDHVHFHIFPKSEGMRIPGGASGPWIFEVAARQVGWHGTAERIEAAAEAIRDCVARRVE